MPTLETVEQYSNGENLDSDVLNRPIIQLSNNQVAINNYVEGLINDATTSTTTTWSSAKLETEIANANASGVDNSIVYAIALG